MKMTSTGHADLRLCRRYMAALTSGLLVLIGCQTQMDNGAPRPVSASDYYGEERLAPDRWSVRASGRTPERARDLAFLRGAVLVKAGGYSHIRVVSVRTEGFDYSYAPIETKSGAIAAPAVPPVRAAIVQVAGTNDPAAPLACDASATAGGLCRNRPVDEVLATLGERFGLTPDQTAAAVEAARPR